MRISGEVVSSNHKMMVADKVQGKTYLSKSVVEFFKYNVCLRVFTSIYFFVCSPSSFGLLLF